MGNSCEQRRHGDAELSPRTLHPEARLSSPAMISSTPRASQGMVKPWRWPWSTRHTHSFPSAASSPPATSGTVLRVVDMPPEAKDPEVRRRQTEAVFATLFADATHNAGHARHPGMHVTDTIDYAIVLQGE